MWRQFILTDIIEMPAGGIGISGYDWENKRHIRPKSLNGRTPLSFLQGAKPFTVIELDFSTPDPDGDAPHTENWEFNPDSSVRVGRRLDLEGQIRFLQTIADANVHELFGSNSSGTPLLKVYRNRYYVLPSVGSRSLGMIQVRSIAVGIDSQGRLRVSFTDQEHSIFNDVALVSLELKRKWRSSFESSGNLAQVNRELRQLQWVYVSLSLAPPWQPTNWQTQACLLQIAGVHAYTH